MAQCGKCLFALQLTAVFVFLLKEKQCLQRKTSQLFGLVLKLIASVVAPAQVKHFVCGMLHRSKGNSNMINCHQFSIHSCFSYKGKWVCSNVISIMSFHTLYQSYHLSGHLTVRSFVCVKTLK